MYSSLPGFILGFHGCDEHVAEKVLSGHERLLHSINDYDWLGHGIYFWENNPGRALEYAETIRRHPECVRNPIRRPAVIGAIIDLGNCLNLLESKSVSIVKQGYISLMEMQRKSEFAELPENKKMEDGFPMLRHLDCAVMEMVHACRKAEDESEFDSVRAMFPEGENIYPNSGFLEKNHIQVCVRNPNCIKGYFRVLKPVDEFSVP